MRVTILSVMLHALAATCVVAQPAAPARLISTRLLDQDPEQSRAIIAAGRHDGASLGDQVFIMTDPLTAIRGEVFFITDKRSVAHLASPARELPADSPAAVVPQAGLPALLNAMPDGVTLHGRVTRTPPGRRTAWIDRGERSGLTMGQSLLVRRKGIPIARARVVRVEPDAALCTLERLVLNAVTSPDDHVEVWPSPAASRLGRLNSTVLDAREGDESPVLTIVGTPADGLAQGRLVDFYRDGAYVGVGSIVETADPLSAVQLIEAASRSTPRVGDLALVRSPPRRDRPLTAAVFKVQDDYALFAAGETDGIQTGDRFIAREPDPDHPGRTRDVAELNVRAVKMDYSGATVRPLVSGLIAIQPWLVVHRAGVPVPTWKNLGRIERITPDAATAVARAPVQGRIEPGETLRLADATAQPVGAALVIHTADDHVVLHIPPGWADVPQIEPVHVQSARHEPRSTRATQPVAAPAVP